MNRTEIALEIAGGTGASIRGDEVYQGVMQQLNELEDEDV